MSLSRDHESASSFRRRSCHTSPRNALSARAVSTVAFAERRSSALLAITTPATAFYVFKEIPRRSAAAASRCTVWAWARCITSASALPNECTCECLGFYRHGNCKHVQGLLALVGHGLI